MVFAKRHWHYIRIFYVLFLQNRAVEENFFIIRQIASLLKTRHRIKEEKEREAEAGRKSGRVIDRARVCVSANPSYFFDIIFRL